VSGLKAGHKAIRTIVEGCHSYIYPHLYGKPLTADELAFATGDERTGLVLEPLRLIHEIKPKFIALEQVKQVLPIWEQYAWVLRQWGYTTDYGVISAEQYGVPQTRERAILVARNDGKQASLPAPTHSRFNSKNPDGLDKGLLPWVSMVDGVDFWPDEWVGFPRKADGREEIELNGQRYRKRDLRSAMHPAFTITEKARSWSRWRQGRDARMLDISEALQLQSFPAGYPVMGSRTSQFLQVANAIPPKMAAAILEGFTS
jgi:DNA (cytosine-5)-methyltransferase 1